jgi:hypothetical protein
MIRDMETNRKRWLRYELGKTKTKIVIRTYVKMLMSGRIDWEKLGQMYRPDQKQPIWTLKRLLKQTETKRMIDSEIDKLLQEEGITAKFNIEQRKEVLVKALEKGDLTNANRALDKFDEFLGMKPQERKQIVAEETNWIELLHKHDNKSLPSEE